VIALLCAGLIPLQAIARSKWEPIAPADLAATECKSYPGSSAEVLFRRTTLDASRNESWSKVYLRIKIYSPKGAEEIGVLGLEYLSWQSVWDLAARVTKPDGAATEYGKENYNDTVVVKTQDAKIKRKTLAVPNLEAGDVVEMQWTATFSDAEDYSGYCQDTVPVRECSLTVKGLKSDYNIFSFNVAKTEGKQPGGGQAQLVMRDMPPFESEPHMGPMRDVRGWFQLVTTNPYLRWYSQPDEIWKLISSYEEEDFGLITKPGLVIKEKAKELIQGAASDDEKLARLYDFCQANIDNLTYFDTPDLQKARKKLEGQGDDKQSTDETLERKFGYPHHINELFASLARAAGFQVKLVLCASRNNTLNVLNSKGWLFVQDRLVAVQRGNDWELFSPGDYYSPAGMIDRSNEIAPYLRCEQDKVVYGQVPVAPAEKSPVVRKAHFQIDADGNLEGDVVISMGGHAGSSRKGSWANKQQAVIDEDFKTAITDRLPGAEVSEITWEHLRGNALPLVVRYKVKVPGYAEAAGSKMVFTPNYFEHKGAALFSAETRRFPIFFDYAWAEHDDIEYQLPEGFVIEAPSAPAEVGDVRGVMGVHYQLGYKPRKGVLSYHRDYALGGNGAVAFQAGAYPKLKLLCDAITRSDEHSLLLKPAPVRAKPQGGAGAAAPAGGPSPVAPVGGTASTTPAH